MTDPSPTTRFAPHGAVLAALFPGLGHFVLGERKRGVFVAIGVLFLFLSGLFIGGIDVIDSREDRLWYLAQLGVGPITYAVDYAHQNRFKVVVDGVPRSAYPGEKRGPGGRPVQAAEGEPPPNIKSVGRMNELGILFCTMASFINLIAIIDAAFRREPA